MLRITFGRFPRLAILAVAAVLSLGFAASVSADTPPGRGPSGSPTPTPAANDCAVLRVHLNGDRPATHTCLATAAAGQGTVTAGISSTNYCLANDLQIYQDYYHGGKRLCFYGSGSVNLKDYGLGWFSSWSDKMSSYKTGSYCGIFWQDSNQSGFQLRFYAQQNVLYTEPLWNDRVSSISVFASCLGW
jgi:hypothetical protein